MIYFQFHTLGSRPSGKPRDLRVISPTPDCLDLRWEDPDIDTWNGPIVSYKIGWKRQDENVPE